MTTRMCVCVWGGGDRETQTQTLKETDRQNDIDRDSHRWRDITMATMAPPSPTISIAD